MYYCGAGATETNPISGLSNSENKLESRDVVVEHPIPNFKEIVTVYIKYPDYVQVLIEFEDGLLITDAAPSRSKIILDWVAANMHGKRISHVVPSHHHRDHAGGVDDYLAAGATLVVPEVAQELYNITGNASQIQVYTNADPFVLKDNNVQFRSFWRDENPHAKDWISGIATKTNPGSDDGFIVFNADVIRPGTSARKWDTGAARVFFTDAVRIGLPRSALLVGAHGPSHNGTSTTEQLENLANFTAFAYPSLTVEDWNTRNV